MINKRGPTIRRPWSDGSVSRRSVLEKALRECNGNVARTARVLSIKRSWLIELLKKDGLTSLASNLYQASTGHARGRPPKNARNDPSNGHIKRKSPVDNKPHRC